MAEHKQYPSFEDLVVDLLAKKELPVVKVKCEVEARDSVASSHLKVMASLKGGKEMPLFLKIRKAGSVSAQFDQSLLMFDREETMYSKVLPILFSYHLQGEAVTTDKHLSHLFPPYYGSGMVGEDLFLMFGDILHGDKMFVSATDQFHTVDQVRQCLERLGTFHALSFARKQQEGANWVEQFPLLRDTLFLSHNKELIDMVFAKPMAENIKILRAVHKVLAGDSTKSKGRITQLCNWESLETLVRLPNKYSDILHKVQEPQEPYAVVTHGDFHMWNMAFGKEVGDPDIKFFDLQFSRYTSGLVDVHHYLSQVTTTETRSKHLSEFLDIYRASLLSTCVSLGMEREVLEQIWSQEWVMAEYHRVSPWGLVFGLGFNLGRFVKNMRIVLEALDSSSLDPSEHSNELLTALDQAGPQTWWGVQQLMDLVIEMEGLGAMEQI